MRPEPKSCRPSARRIVASVAVLSGCLILATPVLAQQQVSRSVYARSPGMRYLTWPGKVERAPATVVASPSSMADDRAEYAAEDRAEDAREEPASRGPILSLPDQPVIAPVATRYSARTSPGPTPASAWVSNGGAPTYGTPTYAAPAYSPPAYAAAPTPTFEPAPPLERTDLRPRVYAPPASDDARVATLPEPPRDYAPVIPLDAPPPRPERRFETPTYAPPVIEAPVEPTRPVAADTGPAYDRSVDEAETRLPVATSPIEPTPRPMPEASNAPAPVEAAPVVDPYAPRADAPIFRLLNRNSQPAPVPEPVVPSTPPSTATPTTATQPAPQPTAQATPQPYPAPAEVDRSPRRYSVHRANGQSPDRIPLPEPVLLDSAPVDLAEPPETPTVIRNVNGRLTAITPSSEDPAQP